MPSGSLQCARHTLSIARRSVLLPNALAVNAAASRFSDAPWRTATCEEARSTQPQVWSHGPVAADAEHPATLLASCHTQPHATPPFPPHLDTLPPLLPATPGHTPPLLPATPGHTHPPPSRHTWTHSPQGCGPNPNLA
eukprot:354548-Chlamydomonas_euryale.AAC.1